MQDELIAALPARTGHFLLESGHHGDLWLDLDAFFLRPAALRPFAVELAKRLSAHAIDAVCGPLTGGAFVAQMIAAELDLACFHAERIVRGQGAALPAVEYRIPHALRAAARGKNVAIVDDAINAGSALRGTAADLQRCGAHIVAIGALLVLGPAASHFAADRAIPLEHIAALPNVLWSPADRPLCAARIPLDDIRAFP
ncbi:MAG: orotate phosphoribosyltransferase [Thermomicrobiales bacterium]